MEVEGVVLSLAWAAWRQSARSVVWEWCSCLCLSRCQHTVPYPAAAASFAVRCVVNVGAVSVVGVHCAIVNGEGAVRCAGLVSRFG